MRSTGPWTIAWHPVALAAATPGPVIPDRFLETRRNHLYVLDDARHFLGVSLHDLKRILLHKNVAQPGHPAESGRELRREDARSARASMALA